jgi:nucleotide-binding universal stress UspA family protein
MSNVRKILVAVDFSEDSRKTLQYAFDFFQGCGVEIHVVHVIYDPLPAGSYIPHRSVDEMEKSAVDLAMEDLKKFISRKVLTSEEKVEPVVLCGTPYAELLDYGKKHGIELIVIGSQGMSRLEKMLLGNVTDKVVRKSSVPVMVYKG